MHVWLQVMRTGFLLAYVYREWPQQHYWACLLYTSDAADE